MNKKRAAKRIKNWKAPIRAKKLTKERIKFVKNLAKDIFENKVFTSLNIRENEQDLIPTIFMPLVFLDEEQITNIQEDDISVFYEYYSKAGPRSINGYPCFFSVGMLSKTEWKITCIYLKRYEAFLKQYATESDVDKELMKLVD